MGNLSSLPLILPQQALFFFSASHGHYWVVLNHLIPKKLGDDLHYAVHHLQKIELFVVKALSLLSRAAGLSPSWPLTVLVTFSKTSTPNLSFCFYFLFLKMALMLLFLFYSHSAGHSLILTMAICAPLGTMSSLTEVAGSTCYC